MRSILLAFTILVAIVVPSQAAAGKLDARIESLSWLSGEWKRTGLPDGDSGHEYWRVEGTTLIGTGSTHRKGRAPFMEQLRIEVNEEEVFYVADTPGNKAPIRFKIVEQTDNAAAFENPEHDFPNRISYRREEDRLYAEISGSGRSIKFEFERATKDDSVRHISLEEQPMHNLINWFEIPAADFERALRFYSGVLRVTSEVVEMGGTRMGMLPGDGKIVTGAIVHGEGYEPGARGTLIYLAGGDDLSPMLDRVKEAGGTVVVPKTEISPEFGFFAIFIDSEGNKVGMHSPH